MVAVPLKVTSTKKKGEYEIRSYAVKKLQNLGQGATLTKLLQLLDYVGAPLMDEGEALGYFNGTQKFRVAFKDDKPVAVHMKGETEDDEVFNKKFGKKGVFGKTGGGLTDDELWKKLVARANQMPNKIEGLKLKSLTGDAKAAAIAEFRKEWEEHTGRGDTYVLGEWVSKEEMEKGDAKPLAPAFSVDTQMGYWRAGSRLNVKGGRTKRNRRGHKRGQTRKLAARRR